MVQALTKIITKWVDICLVSEIAPNTGVCALVEAQQVAIFRVGSGVDVFAIRGCLKSHKVSKKALTA